MTKFAAVKELRRRVNMSQEDFAAAARVSVRTVSVYETGDTAGSEAVLERFGVIAMQYGYTDLAKILAPKQAVQAFVDMKDVAATIDRIHKLQEELDVEMSKLRRIFGSEVKVK